MPVAGRQTPVGTSTLAVGKPSSAPPRRSPVTTGPLTWWGRPRRVAACSTRPSDTRVRTRVEEIVSPGRPPGPRSASWDTPSTAKPATDPISFSRATLPLRLCPKWKSSPTTTRRVSRLSTRTSSTNASADSLARSSSKERTTVRSTPAASSNSSFCSRSHSRDGADSGRTTVAGCRSKVTTTVVRPSASARVFSSARSARWPRCTPSYAPMVTAEPPTGGWEVDGSVTMSITGEGYRRVTDDPSVAARLRRAQRRSSCRLDHHGRTDAVGLGRLVDRQQTVPLVDQAPRTGPGNPEWHPVERQATRHELLDVDGHHHLIEVTQGLGRSEHHGRGQLVDQPGVFRGKRPDPCSAEVLEMGAAAQGSPQVGGQHPHVAS